MWTEVIAVQFLSVVFTNLSLILEPWRPTMLYRFRAFCVTALVTMPVLFTGISCGKGDYPAISRVTGTVTYKGKAVPNMMVNFMPTEGRPSWGRTDAAGKFEMVYDSDYKGVKMGHHKVYITPPASTIDGGTSKASKHALAEAANLTPEEMLDIRSKYGAEEVTKYEVDVKTDPEVVNITLE